MKVELYPEAAAAVVGLEVDQVFVAHSGKFISMFASLNAMAGATMRSRSRREQKQSVDVAEAWKA